ncbi:MAG TPA: hypothetical protein VFF40_07750 [Acidimicrobiia bacterium]|nr:hypothetical protein [Acidimicrobiia bacterium]
MEHLGRVGLAGSRHELAFAALTGLDASTALERVAGTCRLPDERLDIGSRPRAGELGKLRVEGKDDGVVDGDVVEFRFNV